MAGISTQVTVEQLPHEDELSLSDLRHPDRQVVESAAQDLATRVQRISYRVCADDRIRDDVNQTTLLKVLSAVANGRSSKEGSIHAYLETAVRRNAMVIRAAEARHAAFTVKDKSDQLELSAREKGLLDNLVQLESIAQMRLALRCLTNSDREMITSFLLDDVSAQEIAEKQGCSRTVVFNRLKRIKTELAAKLENPFFERELTSKDMEEVLRELSPLQREAFFLVEVLGYKRRAIDRTLKLRIGSTDNRLRSAHDALYRKLGVAWPKALPELRRRYPDISADQGRYIQKATREQLLKTIAA